MGNENVYTNNKQTNKKYINFTYMRNNQGNKIKTYKLSLNRLRLL